MECHGALLHGLTERVEVPGEEGLADGAGESRSTLDPTVVERRRPSGSLHAFGRADFLGPLRGDRDQEANVPVVDRRQRLGGERHVARLPRRQLCEAAEDGSRRGRAGPACHGAEASFAPL